MADRSSASDGALGLAQFFAEWLDAAVHVGLAVFRRFASRKRDFGAGGARVRPNPGDGLVVFFRLLKFTVNYSND